MRTRTRTPKDGFICPYPSFSGVIDRLGKATPGPSMQYRYCKGNILLLSETKPEEHQSHKDSQRGDAQEM